VCFSPPTQHNAALHHKNSASLLSQPRFSVLGPGWAGLIQSTLSTCDNLAAAAAAAAPAAAPAASKVEQEQKLCIKQAQEFQRKGTNLQNRGLISTDRSNKATLLLTIPCFKIKVVCNGFIFSNI
jgi:hypothetical protein